MPDQIEGYHVPRQDKLLRDFDRTAELMRGTLAARYGQEFTSELHQDARDEYAKLVPEVPLIKGARGMALSIFFIIAAQELAVYKAIQRRGMSPAEAWEICHQALRLRVAQIAPWKKRLLGWLMFAGPVKKAFARRQRAQEIARIGDFEVAYLGDQGQDFDLGVNYLRCAILEFVNRHEGEAFAPYVCMSDVVLSDALGWGLIRTQTLADGCSCCDFRFKKGGPTRISSKTPQVQETIQRIREQEAAQGT